MDIIDKLIAETMVSHYLVSHSLVLKLFVFVYLK